MKSNQQLNDISRRDSSMISLLSILATRGDTFEKNVHLYEKITSENIKLTARELFNKNTVYEPALKMLQWANLQRESVRIKNNRSKKVVKNITVNN